MLQKIKIEWSGARRVLWKAYLEPMASLFNGVEELRGACGVSRVPFWFFTTIEDWWRRVVGFFLAYKLVFPGD